MNTRTLRPLVAAVATVACLSAAPASAELLYLGTTADLGLNDLTFGAGVGNVATVLSLRPQGSATATCGQVTPGASGDVVANCGGSETTFAAAGNNQTYTFAELGVTDADQLRFIFNVNESDDLVTLTELSALFYDSSGSLYHTAVYTGMMRDFPEFGSGIGGQGYVFGLTEAEVMLVNAQYSVANVVGARFAVSGASGGFETLNVVALDDEITPGPGDNVPEPTSLVLLGAAMLGAGVYSRRR